MNRNSPKAEVTGSNPVGCAKIQIRLIIRGFGLIVRGAPGDLRDRSRYTRVWTLSSELVSRQRKNGVFPSSGINGSEI